MISGLVWSGKGERQRTPKTSQTYEGLSYPTLLKNGSELDGLPALDSDACRNLDTMDDVHTGNRNFAILKKN